MSKIKRVLSLFLAVVMAFTVMSVGFSFTASAAAPYVTRTPVNPPTPANFSVPAYITVYGTNIFTKPTSAYNVKAAGSVTFYIVGASNISLSTNSSGVTTKAYVINNNVYTWDISGGILSNTSATRVKFTVSYDYNGKPYTTSAWSAVKITQTDAAIFSKIDAHSSSAWRDFNIRTITFVSPSYGSIGVENNANTFYYNNAENQVVYTQDENKSGYRWDHDGGSITSEPTYTMDSAYAPTATYYADRSLYTNKTMQELPLNIYMRDIGSSIDDNHTVKLSELAISGQYVDGNSTTLYGLTGTVNGYTFSEASTCTAKLTGPIPASGSAMAAVVKTKISEKVTGGLWVSHTIWSESFIVIYVSSYDKGDLRTLVNSEKTANRQAGDYMNTASSETDYRTWDQYAAAYETAWEILGRENTSQAAVTAAYNALNDCVPKFTSLGVWYGGIKYAEANYATADHYIGLIPARFTNNKYSDGTCGSYYTYTTANNLNKALEDLNYDRPLDKRYQANVDTMAQNITAAVSALQYKTFNIVFNGNGATDAPATAGYKLYTSIYQPTTVPTLTHYRFTGWYSDSACTQLVTWPLVMSPENSYFTGSFNNKSDTPSTGIALYAGWQLDATTVNFVSNGDAPVSPAIGHPGESVVFPADPTRAGYTFVGWCSDSACTTLIDKSTYKYPSSNVTLYGKWQIAQFSVTFNSNGGTFTGGSATKVITQNYNTAVAEPEIPTKYGMGFAGWYFDNTTFNNAVNFASFTMPSSNTTVYAKWSSTIYTITYNSNGGSTVPYASYAAGDSVVAPSAPIRAGYSFASWCSDENLSNPVSFPFLMTAGSKIFYAKWTPLKYNVYFDLGDSSYPATASFAASFNAGNYYNLNCGSVLVAPEEPTMEGYVFKGWTYNGVAYTFTTVPATNITLVASWEVEPALAKYRIRTDAASSTLQQGDVINVTVSIWANYIVGSHNFILYYDKRYFEPALNGSAYTTVQNGASACNTNGTTFFTMIDNQTGSWNTWQNGTVTGRVNNNTAAMAQYYPAAWRASTTALLEEYSNYNYVYFQVANTSQSPSAGYCVMPKPEQDLCRFQLKVKDDAPITGTDDYAQLLMPDIFTRASDATFGKIYAALEDGNEYDTAYQATGIEYALINNDVRFAVDEMASSTITFVTNSVSTVNPITEKVGRTIALPTPEKPYYNFLGWTTTATGTAYVNKDAYVVGAADVTLYAQWSAQQQSYKVRHWKQNIAGTGYLAEYEEETFYGTIGSTVTATSKTYSGFTCSNTQTGTIVEDGSLVLNLYYNRNNITLTLNPSGGVLTSPTTLSGLYGAEVTAPSNPNRTGYSFNGWLYNSVAYSFTTFPASSIELVASWTANKYTFRFFLNNTLKEEYTITQEYNTNVTAPTVTVPSGMVFSGWLYNGSPYTFTKMPAANMDFYGTLDINGYYVTLYVDGTQYGDPIAVFSGTPLTAAQVAYTPESGYSFSGWKLSNNANGVAATFPLTPAANMSLYGFTSRAKYTLTFWIVGESEYYSRVTNIAYGANIVSQIPESPDVEGYEFKAWYLDEDLTEEYTISTMPAQNLDLYGGYIELTGTIEFDVNGGSGTAPASIEPTIWSEVTAAELPDATGMSKEGFVFIGWGLTRNDTEAIESYYVETTEPVTLYAIWAPATVEIVPRTTANAVVDKDNHYISGLKLGVTEEEIKNTFLGVSGNGTIRVNYSGSIGTGTTVDLISNYTGLVVETFTIVIYGDINGDGNITAADMTALKAIISKSSTLTPGTPAFKAVDLNNDGVLNATDTTKLKAVVSKAATINQSTLVVA